MKKLLTILFVILSITGFSQLNLNNNSVTIDANGNLIATKSVNVTDSLFLNGDTATGFTNITNLTGNLGNSTTYPDSLFIDAIVQNGMITVNSCITLIDSATITLPTSKTIELRIWVDADDEYAIINIQNDGTVTIYGTALGSVVNTNTEGNLCIYDNGSGAIIRNNLGSTKKICYEIKYSY